MSKKIIRELLAEAIGVFGLVYFGGWSVILSTAGRLDVLGVGLVHSGILGVLIWSGCAFAGCHFNPALTIGFICIRSIDFLKGIFYIIFQFFGTVLGALALQLSVPSILLQSAVSVGADFGGPHQGTDFSAASACFLEFIGTFMLMFVVKSLCAEDKAFMYAPLIGCVIGMCVLCFGSFTGTGINPFRYFGPALLSGKLGDFYIYIIFPIIGAIAAAFAYEYLFDFSDSEEKELALVQQEI